MTDKQTGARAAAEEIDTRYYVWKQELERGEYTALADRFDIIETIILKHCQDKAVEKAVADHERAQLCVPEDKAAQTLVKTLKEIKDREYVLYLELYNAICEYERAQG